MKKLLFTFFIVFIGCKVISQSTFHKLYSYPSGFLNGYEKIHPVVFGNSLFYAYIDNSVSPQTGPCLQKNNLDGTPVWKKVYTGLGDVQQMQIYNDKILLIGQTTIGTGTSSIAHVFIASIDTSNGSINYLSEQSIPNYYSASINCSKVLSNGDVFIGGSAFMQSSICCRGYFARFNANTGALVYQQLLWMDGAADCAVKSVEEFNNAHLIITGTYSVTSNFAAKITNNATPLVVFSKSFNAQIDHVTKLNSNRLLFHTGGLMLKVDSALNTTPAMTDWVSHSFGSKSYYFLGRLYVVDPSKRLAIIDTTGNMQTSMFTYTYNVPGNNYFSSAYFAGTGTNLYITYDYGSTGGPFSLLKTNLNGNMSCAVTETISPSTFAVASSILTYSLSAYTGTLGTTTPTIINGSVTYTTNCLTATGIINNVFDAATILINNSNAKYTVQSDMLLKEVQIMDISGRVIHSNTLNNQYYQIDLTNESNGIYILLVTDYNGNYKRFKLLK